MRPLLCVEADWVMSPNSPNVRAARFSGDFKWRGRFPAGGWVRAQGWSNVPSAVPAAPASGPRVHAFRTTVGLVSVVGAR